MIVCIALDFWYELVDCCQTSPDLSTHSRVMISSRTFRVAMEIGSWYWFPFWLKSVIKFAVDLLSHLSQLSWILKCEKFLERKNTILCLLEWHRKILLIVKSVMIICAHLGFIYLSQMKYFWPFHCIIITILLRECWMWRCNISHRCVSIGVDSGSHKEASWRGPRWRWLCGFGPSTHGRWAKKASASSRWQETQPVSMQLQMSLNAHTL